MPWPLLLSILHVFLQDLKSKKSVNARIDLIFVSKRNLDHQSPLSSDACV